MTATRLILHFLSILVMLVWSAVLLYFYYSGRVAAYLPPDGIFRAMVLISGLGMAVVAIFNLLTTQHEAAACDHDCGHDHSHDHGNCGHDHSHDHGHAAHDHAHGILQESGWLGRVAALLVLLLPLCWAAVSTPDRYSANAVMNKGLYNPNYQDQTNAAKYALRKDAAAPTATTAAAPGRQAPKPTPMPSGPLPPPAQFSSPEKVAQAAPPPPSKTQSYGSFTLEDLKKQVPQSKDGNFILEVPEIYYTGGDLEVQKVITGQPVETTAQVLPEKVNNEKGHRLRIFRLMVQCCAADARPYSVPVDFGKKAPDFKEMTWVKVIGKMTYRKEGDQTVPVIEATKVEETAAPEDAMVY